MSASHLVLESPALISVHPISFWMPLGINSSVCSTLLCILPVVIARISYIIWPILLIMLANAGFLIFNIALVYIVPIVWMPLQVSLPATCFAWLALRMQYSSLSISQVKVFSSSRFNIVACSTFSKSLWKRIQGFISIASSLTFGAFADFTQGTQAVGFSSVRPEELPCSGFVLVTARTKLQWVRLLWTWIDFQIFNRLRAQYFKIKCALDNVLRYTCLHSLGQLLAITAPAITSSAGPNTYSNVPQVYQTRFTSKVTPTF